MYDGVWSLKLCYIPSGVPFGALQAHGSADTAPNRERHEQLPSIMLILPNLMMLLATTCVLQYFSTRQYCCCSASLNVSACLLLWFPQTCQLTCLMPGEYLTNAMW